MHTDKECREHDGELLQKRFRLSNAEKEILFQVRCIFHTKNHIYYKNNVADYLKNIYHSDDETTQGVIRNLSKRINAISNAEFLDIPYDKGRFNDVIGEY